MKKRYDNFMLMLLGFISTSCGGLFGMMEYGCPHADFTVKGRVVDEEGKPISGIQVTPIHEDAPYPVSGAKALTDVDGKFDLSFGEMSSNEKFRLAVDDIDGEANGKFKPDTVFIKNFTQVKKGDKNWYEGAYAAEQGDIVLKKDEE